MKPVSLFLAFIVTFVLLGCASQQSVSKESGNKVLIILRDSHEEPGRKKDLRSRAPILMKSMLEEAGFKAVVASASGRTFLFIDKTLKSDLKLANVKVADYVGFIIPSMSETDPIPPEAITIVKEAVAMGKPVAAQRWGIAILAQAGVLAGREFPFPNDPQYKPYAQLFVNAKYNGAKIFVQDGNIITNSSCPIQSDDGATQITQTLIAELQK